MTGLTTLAAGLVLGAPVWLALHAYPAVGSTTLLVVPLARMAWDGRLAKGRPDLASSMPASS